MISRKEADRRCSSRGMTCHIMLTFNPDGTVEVVEKDRAPSALGAVEAFTSRCYVCGEEIGWGAFHVVGDQRVHAHCTREF